MVGQMSGIVGSLYQSMPILTTGDSSHLRQAGKQDCVPVTVLILFSPTFSRLPLAMSQYLDCVPQTSSVCLTVALISISHKVTVSII